MQNNIAFKFISKGSFLRPPKVPACYGNGPIGYRSPNQTKVEKVPKASHSKITVEVVTYLCKSWIIYETPMTEASVVHRHLPYLNFINFKVHIFFVPGQRKKIFANK